MIKIIAIVLQLIGVCAGVFIGFKLKYPDTGDSAVHSEGGDDHGDDHADDKKKKKKKKKSKKKDDHGKSDDHGDDHSAAESNGAGFLKFSRQFIVPVLNQSGVNSLIVLDLNLELPPNVAETAYSREPKIRDALLSTLLVLSTEGAFNDNLLAPENLDMIRARLLESARSVLGDDVIQVLIVSIAKQNL